MRADTTKGGRRGFAAGTFRKSRELPVLIWFSQHRSIGRLSVTISSLAPRIRSQFHSLQKPNLRRSRGRGARPGIAPRLADTAEVPLGRPDRRREIVGLEASGVRYQLDESGACKARSAPRTAAAPKIPMRRRSVWRQTSGVQVCRCWRAGHGDGKPVVDGGVEMEGRIGDDRTPLKIRRDEAAAREYRMGWPATQHRDRQRLDVTTVGGRRGQEKNPPGRCRVRPPAACDRDGRRRTPKAIWTGMQDRRRTLPAAAERR